MIHDFEKALAFLQDAFHKNYYTDYKPQIEITLKTHDYHNVQKILFEEAKPTQIKVPTEFNNDNSSFKIELLNGSIIFRLQSPRITYNPKLFKSLF